ncbi:hypothetical protein [Phaffia rhodozyma]|uniref:Uncharacterized protein n=1 Tax=Phaffia rhodozyma TaxID=264483 RepID=A0A0F7SPS0_PHARH|nr:hypothetical protein [Phaffia rhodozyma]
MALVPKGRLRTPLSLPRPPPLPVPPRSNRSFSSAQFRLRARLNIPFTARPAAQSTSGGSSSKSRSSPLSALQNLAKSLFGKAPKRFFNSSATSFNKKAFGHKWLPSDMASRIRLANASPTFHPVVSGLRAGTFRGPMGPGVKYGFKVGGGVAQVGLGSARGYATAARPLFENLLGNVPLVLRALGNSLEDEAEKLAKKRAHPRSTHFFKKTASSSSSGTSSLLGRTFKIDLAHKKAVQKSFPAGSVAVELEEEVVVETDGEELTASLEEEFDAFFGPSIMHILPAPRSPGKKTTLSIPFNIDESIVPDHQTSLSRLAAFHRESYRAHAARIDGLLTALADRGVFLDDHVREETIVDEPGGDITGLKVVWLDRDLDEVRSILRRVGVDVEGTNGENSWWFLLGSERDCRMNDLVDSSFVYPTLSFAASSVLVSQATGQHMSTAERSERALGYSNVSSGISFSSGFLSQVEESDIESDEETDDEWSGSESGYGSFVSF